MATTAAPKAALARCTLLLVAGLALCAAAPLKVPTARKGECWDKMLAEIKASDLPGKVRQGSKPRCHAAPEVGAASGALAGAGAATPLPRSLARLLYCPPHCTFNCSLQGYGMIFYGDSITESLRGSDKCRPCETSTVRSSCSGVPQVRGGGCSWAGQPLGLDMRMWSVEASLHLKDARSPASSRLPLEAVRCRRAAALAGPRPPPSRPHTPIPPPRSPGPGQVLWRLPAGRDGHVHGPERAPAVAPAERPDPTRQPGARAAAPPSLRQLPKSGATSAGVACCLRACAPPRAICVCPANACLPPMPQRHTSLPTPTPPCPALACPVFNHIAALGGGLLSPPALTLPPLPSLSLPAAQGGCVQHRRQRHDQLRVERHQLQAETEGAGQGDPGAGGPVR